MKIRLTIDNVYDDDTVTTEAEVDVPAPPDQSDESAYDDWAFDHIYPATGTDRPEGDAGYFATVTACDDDPSLVGREFEFGV